MAVLALAAAGSMIGGAMITGTVLGMSGAAIGWMAGSMLGGILFAPKLPDGPRLNDLSVQNSSYGASIPRVWGANRIAGNVIWSTDLVEHAHEEGGKGSGGSYTTYTYTVSFAVSLCEGPISGVRRIWADGKLIYDTSVGVTNQIGFTASSYTCYLGTEMQAVDPTIQAHMTNTPAYRGQAYWVFADLELTKYGNRIPNLTFEVVQVGTSDVIPPVYVGAGGFVLVFEGKLWTVGNGNLRVYDATTKAYLTTVVLPYRAYSLTTDGVGVWVGYEVSGSSNDNCASRINPITMTIDLYTDFGYDGAVSKLGTVAWNAWRRWIYSATSNGIGHGIRYYNVDTGVVGGSGIITPDWTFEALEMHDIAKIAFTGYGNWLTIGDMVTDSTVATVYIDGWSYGSGQRMTYDSKRTCIYWMRVYNIGIYKLDLNSYESTLFLNLSNPQMLYYESRNDSLYVEIGADIFQYSAATGALLNSYLGVGISTNASRGNAVASDVGFFTGQFITDPGTVYHMDLGFSIDPSKVPLADIVTDLSLACGLTANDIDVTALTDQVYGFPLARQGSARSALEYLMMAFLFDAVESEGKVKFVKRGAPSALTITTDDLAVHEQGQTVPAVLEMTRADEIELPRNVSLKYINFEADYQTSAQNAMRQSGRALSEMTMEMPVVMVDTHAKSVADYALYSAWAARTSAKWATSLKFAKIEPTDVVTVADNLLRVTKRSLQGNILSFEGVMESGITVASAALAGVANSVSQAIVIYGDTVLMLLDVPMLRDEDDDAGFYMAASGEADEWPGCVPLKSIDAGATFGQMQAMITPSIIGVAGGVLGDFTENTFDEFNTVEVTVYSGELASTSELLVLNGGNAAVLGNEVIQFKTATLVSEKTYVLSGLLRGRKGTPTGGHVLGERFVLLNPATLRRAPPNAAEIGLARIYRAITIGAAFSSGVDIPFTNTAQGLECLSPVQLGGGRDAAGNLTLTWVRRTRVGGEWRDLVDASLGEATESYSIDICDDDSYATVVRVLTSLIPTVAYSAADQVTDFGSAQATVYAVVYQISATMSRGAPLQGAI